MVAEDAFIRNLNRDIVFLISDQNINFKGSLEPLRSGGSNKHPKTYILNKNKKNSPYSCKPHFSLYKVGFKGV